MRSLLPQFHFFFISSLISLKKSEEIGRNWKKSEEIGRNWKKSEEIGRNKKIGILEEVGRNRKNSSHHFFCDHHKM
jgi:hypothetical protein